MLHFNTSYVVIKRGKQCKSCFTYGISIHLMLLLNDPKLQGYPKDRLISIHLMLLLNDPKLQGYPKDRLISIHLMLLLNMP